MGKAYVQSRFQDYFNKLNRHMTKPEILFIPNITIGILQSHNVTLLKDAHRKIRLGYIAFSDVFK